MNFKIKFLGLFLINYIINFYENHWNECLKNLILQCSSSIIWVHLEYLPCLYISKIILRERFFKCILEENNSSCTEYYKNTHVFLDDCHKNKMEFYSCSDLKLCSKITFLYSYSRFLRSINEITPLHFILCVITWSWCIYNSSANVFHALKINKMRIINESDTSYTYFISHRLKDFQESVLINEKSSACVCKCDSYLKSTMPKAVGAPNSKVPLHSISSLNF